MRFWSTSESTRRGEVSVLSIIETLVAMGCSFYFSLKYQSVLPIVIPSCFALFLLLRTDQSTERGLRYFTWIYEKSYKLLPNYNSDKASSYFVYYLIGSLMWSIPVYYFWELKISLIVFITLFSLSILYYFLIEKDYLEFITNYNGKSILVLLGVVVVVGVVVGGVGGVGGVGVVGGVVGGVGGVGAIIARVCSIFVSLFKNFISSVLAIPDNWRKIILSTSLSTVPELVPGIDDPNFQKNTTHLKHLKFKSYYQGILSMFNDFDVSTIFEKIIKYTIILFIFLITGLFSLIIYTPSLIYRWSLKSSTWLWLPLVLAINVYKKPDSIKEDSQKSFDWFLASKSKTIGAWLILIWSSIIIISYISSAYINIKLIPLAKEHLENVFINYSDSNFFRTLTASFYKYFFMENISSIKGWHISRMILAVFNISLFITCNYYLVKRSNIANADFDKWKYMKFVKIISILLSFYTIICGLWIFMNNFDLLTLDGWNVQFKNLFNAIKGIDPVPW